MQRLFHFRTSSSQLGPLEERLLETLWKRGSATVRDLVEGDCLFKKKLLARQPEGRAFRYVPRLSREGMHRQVAGEAFRQWMDASPASSLPLSYLVEIVTERDAQLLDELRQVVEAKRRELRRGESRTDSKNKDKDEDKDKA
jgi:predicted transcriptional regulator